MDEDSAKELVRVNRALRTISGINQVLIRSQNEDELLKEACKIAVDVAGYRLAWVGYAQFDQAKSVKPMSWAGQGSDYLKDLQITWADTKRGRGPTGTAIRTGQAQVARNIPSDPNMEPWRQSALEHGYKSSIALDIEEGHLRLKVDSIPIGDLLESASLESLQPAKLKNIAVKIDKPPEPLPELQGDATKIRDTVQRLAQNSIAYTNDGGAINVRYFAFKTTVRFEIADNGIGIPASEQDKIFERFHRAWNASKMQPNASGLGLFIAKCYVNAHHGSIGFKSIEGQGSVFWFELPLVQPLSD